MLARIGIWGFFCVSLWGLLTCTTPRKSKTDQIKGNLNKGQQAKLDELRAEIDVGRNMAGRLLAFYGVVDDAVLAGYLNQVGAFVASYSDFPERRYMFQVLDSTSINAFACPGGYILVTKGAVKHALNEAELAFVLGHEIAHVGKKHMFDTLTDMSKEDLEKAADEAEKANLKLSPELRARKRPEVEENETGAMLAKYLSGSAAGLNILSAAKAGMSLILERGLGAEKEFEADEEGTRYAVRAGYYPQALMNFLCRIEQKNKKQTGKCRLVRKKKNKKGKSILDKTHPPVIDRVATIKKTLQSLGALDAPGARGEKRFERYKKRIL